MLMVIFGAGASFDSSSDFRPYVQSPWRPPLAGDLFRDTNGVFGDIVIRYPKLLPLLPHLRQPMAGRSVEQQLELYRDEAGEDTERKRQLFSVRYYLRDLLSKVTKEWLKQTNHVTNYVTLIDQIRHYRRGKERVGLVTFNYDLLLDRALLSFNYKPQSPEKQFDAHPIFCLFKPHGSVDWARFVQPNDPAWYSNGDPEMPPGPEQLIENAHYLKLSDGYVVANASDPNEARSFPKPIAPAIAVPVQTKTEDTFEWPASHRAHLEELLTSVTKILIIGWQAREAHFLGMLRTFLPRLRVTHLMVVSASEEDAWQILKHFTGAIGQLPGHHSVNNGGFTDFVINQQGIEFFKA